MPIRQAFFVLYFSLYGKDGKQNRKTVFESRAKQVGQLGNLQVKSDIDFEGPKCHTRHSSRLSILRR